MTTFTKPSGDEALALLKAGNERFVAGTPQRLHQDIFRIRQAGRENQADHAYATVLSCSDSRVPVELIFDAGVMDLFVVRVAGNVCGIHEAGTIEYGIAHVNTPLLVVLGHTQCGAVTAMRNHVQGAPAPPEENIPPLIAPIRPAVERALNADPRANPDSLLSLSIEENIWESIAQLLQASATTRDALHSGSLRILPAHYDVGTGRVQWLPEEKVATLLALV
jgi:carbonic anhydrase